MYNINYILYLLLHHHVVAYKDSKGIWVHATIGRWVSEVAKHFTKVGLLLHVSDKKLHTQDTCLNDGNIVLETLGPPGYTWDRLSRMKRIKQCCVGLNDHYDILLVRGPTPRQLTIWKNIKVTRKYFMLVSSLKYIHQRPKLYSISSTYSWFMERYRQKEIKFILESGKLLANSYKTLEEAHDKFGISGQIVSTAIFSEKEFSTLKVRNIHKPVKLLYCGRIEVNKGIIDAIKAVNVLLKKGFEVQLNLVGPIVGRKFSKQIKLLIRTLNMKDKVLFHGIIPYGHELFSFFKNSDVFILPSYTEGFPRVIWEAAANCCPVIATTVGGIPSILKDGIHGILIPPHNYEALADSIKEIVENKHLRKTIVQNIYKLAHEHTVENSAKNLSNIILKDNG